MSKVYFLRCHCSLSFSLHTHWCLFEVKEGVWLFVLIHFFSRKAPITENSFDDLFGLTNLEYVNLELA